jgi:predicted MFS family arabinose efflux permease
MGFSYLGGKLLDRDINDYHLVFLFMALATLGASFAVYRIPSTPLSANSSKNPLKSFSHAWKDKIFGSMLIIWMFLGFGNLIVLPLQVEFMVRPRFGIEATNTQIALAIGIIPLISRVLTTQIWGHLYDRYNFFLVRGMISSAFGLGHLIFFNSQALWGLYLAGVITGIGTGGAQVAWSLWVTKFAPPDKAPEYMGVHTFLTGARGIIAPFIGFTIVTSMSAFGLSILSATLVSISILLLIPLKRAAEKQTRLGSKTA